MNTPKSKICIKCGFSKPIEEFILGSIDAKCGKKESALCKECRQKDVSSWSQDKISSEKDHQDFFEDYLTNSKKQTEKKIKKTKWKKNNKTGLFQ